ncbi:MAG: hypothetical protein N2512_13825, partial [Armatimonadetes bacterium]|nr:hypothetical protein [Armatimonadota bacterium]
MTLAWAPARQAKEGRLPALVSVANPRDAGETAVQVEGRIGVPPVSTAARVSVPAGRTVTVPFTLPVPQGGAGRRGLQFAFSASGRGHRVLLDTACHVWLVKGPRWTSKPDRPPAETSPPSG